MKERSERKEGKEIKKKKGKEEERENGGEASNTFSLRTEEVSAESQRGGK